MNVRLLAACALCSVFLYGGEKPPVTAEAGNATVSISATAYTTRDQIQALVGSDLDGYYTVLKVTLTPKTAKLRIRYDDFMLRTDKDGERTQAMSANQVAGSPDIVAHSVRIVPRGPNSDSTGSIWGGITIAGQKKPAAKDGDAKDDKTPDAEPEKKPEPAKPNPLLATLKEKVIPQSDTEQPVTGLLIFALAKQKQKDLELIYTTPDGPLKLRFR